MFCIYFALKFMVEDIMDNTFSKDLVLFDI